MGYRRKTFNAGQAKRELTLLEVLGFCLFVVFSGPLVSLTLRLTGLSSLDGPVVSSGFYTLLFIPVAYWLDPRIFSRKYWSFPSRAWVGIGVVVLAQLAFESGDPLSPVGHYRLLAALLVGPTAEESVRAVTICPLMQKFGVPISVIATSLLWASLHYFFWTALAQQLILSLIFVYTRRSLCSAVAAHTAMNAIAVWHISFRTIFPH